MVVTNINRDFYKASLELLEVTSLDQAYKVIVKWALKFVDAEFGSIFEVHNHQPIRVYSNSKALFNIIPRKTGGTYLAYKHSEAYIKNVNTLEKYHPTLSKLGISTDISIPLNYGSKRFGVLSVMSVAPKELTPKDLKVLKYFSPLASFSIRQQLLKQKVEETVKERDLFTSIAAHEIKTPITSLTLYIDLLEKKLSTTLSKDTKYINTIKNSLQILNYLTSEFLNTARAKSGKIKYEFKRINLIPLLKKSIHHFYLRYPEHSIGFVKTGPQRDFVVKADEEKLFLAISNLLRNAGKYSDSTKPIVLKANIENDFVHIQITDRGIGIPNKHLKNIFRQYYRANEVTAGMGLGLFLTNSIVQSHKGNINIQSKEGQGTTVSVKLPLYKDVKRRVFASTRPI